MPDLSDAGLSDAEFAGLMAALGPFEPRPHVAVGVSGGADSAALMLLAAAWASALGGEATALVVDHGLRPDSALESQTVVARLRALGHAAVRLAAAPDSRQDDDQQTAQQGNRQARARALRYRLMGDWCTAAGVLHLLVAHHLEDQAETVMLRLGRGSGVDGLAAMAPVVALFDARLLRPLLSVPKAQLVASCQHFGWAPVCDSSNQDQRYRRVQIRDLLPSLAATGITVARLAATARHLGAVRQLLERQTAELAAQALCVDARGFARLDRDYLRQADRVLALRLVAWVLRRVAGHAVAPRFARLERLVARLQADAIPFGVTLGGCRIQAGGARIVIGREAAAMAQPVPLLPGSSSKLMWDGRFCLESWDDGMAHGARALTVGAVGRDAPALQSRQKNQTGKNQLGRADDRPLRLPLWLIETLPAVRDLDGILTVPHLNYDRLRDQAGSTMNFTISFTASGAA